MIKGGAKLDENAWELFFEQADYPLFEEYIAALYEVGALRIGVPRGDESFLERIFHALDGRGVPPESRRPFLNLLLDYKADPTPLLTGKYSSSLADEEKLLLSNALEDQRRLTAPSADSQDLIETDLDLA